MSKVDWVRTDLENMTVTTALNKMADDGYFFICVVDRCAAVLKVSPKGTEAYTILSALHCVAFGKMPESLRREIPRLIAECLLMDPIQIFPPPAPKPEPVHKPSLLRRLLP
jgi:hypothetical protein